MGKANAKQIRIRSLPAATSGMDNEIFNLQKPIQPKIPIGNLIWLKSRARS